MNRLKGKTALITGGTSGIGAAAAKRFQEEGAKVVVTSSSDKNADEARQKMPGIDVIVSDAGEPDATRNLIEQVKAKHGRLDVLFVNAGILKVGASEQVDEPFFDSMFKVNVRGAYFLIKHAIPVLQDGASVILMSSTGSVQGYPGLGVYNATKAAIRSFANTFAIELAARRIRVNCITPGAVDTGLTAKIGLTAEQQESFKQLIESTPLKRAAEPNEIAAAAVYLASDESAYTTGTEIRVDGGATAI